MPWITKRTYRSDIGVWETTRIWQADTSSSVALSGPKTGKKKKKKSTLNRKKAIEYSRQQKLRAQRIRAERGRRERERARQLRKIRLRAAEVQAKQRAADARRRMYKQLQDRAKAIRGTVAPGRVGKKVYDSATGTWGYTPGPTGAKAKMVNVGTRNVPIWKPASQVPGNRGTANVPIPTAPPVKPPNYVPPKISPEQELRMERDARRAAEYKRRQPIRDLQQAQRTKGTTASGKLLEKLVKEAREQQKATGGRKLDGDFVINVMTEYKAYLDAVDVKRKAYEKKLKGFFTMKGGKWYFRNEASKRAYEALAKDKDYTRLMGKNGKGGEYSRLYGPDGKSGSAAVAYSAAEQIGTSQRNYIRDSARKVFLGPRKGRDDKGYLSRLAKWNSKERWMYEATMADIDPARTSLVRAPNGKMRHRTIEEEFKYRQGQYEAEMLREIEELQNKQKLTHGMLQARQKRAMNRPGFAGRGSPIWGSHINSKGERVPGTPGKYQVEMYESMKRLGYDEDTLHNNMDKLEQTVQGAMREWEKDNAHWFQNASKGSAERGIVNGMSRPDRARWLRAVQAHEKELYKSFGAEKPSGLESLLRLPIAKPTMQGLDTLVGLVGTLPRIGSKLITGTSSKVSGVLPSYDQAPKAVKDKVEAERKRYQAMSQSELSKVPGARYVMGIGWSPPSDPYREWLKTPAGKAWYEKQHKLNIEESNLEDQAFLKGVYGNTDIWEKMQAISDYGGRPFRNAGANLVFGIAGDPTSALPLKFTTWLARWKHATDVTRDASKVRRWWDIATEFQKVNEPHLRWRAGIRAAMKDTLKGKEADLLADEVLGKLLGMKAPTRDNAASEFLETIGVNPRTPSGKRILTAAEEAIIEALKKADVNYEDVAKQASEFEHVRAAAEAEARKAKSPHLDRAAERAAAAEAAAIKASEEARHKLNVERTARVGKVLERRTKNVLSRIPSEQPLYRRAGEPLVQPERQVLEMQVGDPVRRAAAEGRQFQTRAPDLHEHAYRPDAAQEAADVVHAITGAQDVVLHDGVQFAPGGYTDAFLQSDTYKQIRAYLDEGTPEGRGPEAAALRQAVGANKEWAKRTLYQHGRESIARRTRELEGLGRQPGEGLVRGKIPWARSRRKDTAYAVEGGRKSHQQHIVTRTEAVERSGAVTPTEELAVIAERRAIEDLKKRIVTGAKKREKGTWSEERWQEELDEIRLIGVVRRSSDLTTDLRSGEGTLFRGRELDHIREGMIPNFIPVGDVLVEDYLRYGEFTHYYETLSLLPELMKGAGYETALMSTILNPAGRAAFGRAAFARVLRTNMIQNVLPGPRDFRQGTAHLFALFHLTLLDAEKAIPEINRLHAQYVTGKISARAFRKGVLAADPTGSMELLRSYSKSIEVLLEAQPDNIFGRAWKVMESRAGVYWADDFAVSEGAFVAAAITPGSLIHPNLALGMIPYGPIARSLPVTHGFTGHLRNIAATMSDLFKASNPSWTDESVIDQFGFIANDRRLSSAERVTKATQIVHYIASRYGNSLRRSRFTTVMHDFSLDAAYTASKATPEGDFMYQQMRSRYIELMAPTRRIDLDVSGTSPMFGVDPRTYDMLGAEFDRQFARSISPGLKRREYNEATRAIFERSYWLTEVTHGNAGLHTSMFLAKMADPTLQRGDSWLGFANSYYVHMVGAGAEEEARLVLREVFEPELRRAVGQAYESITGATPSTGPLPNQWLGGVNEFFIRTGLMPDMERIVSEGRARAERAKGYAEEEAELVAYRDDLMIMDDALRTQREAAQAGETAMYDMATVEHLVDGAAHHAELYTASSRAIDDLVAAGKKRPMDARMRAYHKAYNKLLYGEGGSAAALKYLKGLPADVRPWMMAEVRGNKAAAEMTRLLNSVVHRTIDMGSIPAQVADEMQELVKVIKTMDGGEAFLKGWAEKYYSDLFQSRLIDYIKHEPWFEYIERAKGKVPPTPAEAMYARIKEVKDKLDTALSREERKELLEERRTLGRQLDEMQKGREAPAEPGALPQEPPREPTPDELNSPRVAMSQRALEILEQMTEEQWLDRELLVAQRVRARSKGPRREAAVNRIRNIERAQRVIEHAKTGKPGQFISPKNRRSFAKTVVSLGAERAKALIAPGFITPYVVNSGGLEVEQGRALNRLRLTAKVNPKLKSRVRGGGEPSVLYSEHADEIESAFDVPMTSELLVRFGFPEDMLVDLTVAEFITNLDEFSRSLRAGPFSDFVTAFTDRVDARLGEITGDQGYLMEEWMEDRLRVRGDHFDARTFEKVETEVSDAIAAARQGARRQRRTDLRRLPGNRPENPLSELVESDIRAVIGKAKALNRLGIDPHSYNEARKVLRGPLVRKRYGQQIVAAAAEAATKKLYAAGHTVDDADWDTLFRAERDAAFEARRTAMAGEEAVKLLEQLADEMFGATPTQIIEEFEKRYSKDMNVKGFEPGPITPYQQRTLEEATKTYLGVKNLDDVGEMKAALSAHGQAPPFHNRKAMADWLTKYGFWSPRTGAQIAAAGKESWDISTEAKYYMENWSYVPDWANPDLLRKGGDLNDILHDEVLRGDQFRKWGLFNDNMRARFESGKMTREERARFLVEGSAALGIKAKRDLAMERKYVFERYGDLVTDDAGNLTAFPELMTRDEMRQYVITRTTEQLPIAKGIMQSPEEVEKFYAAIDRHVGWMVDNKYLKGQTVTYEDVFEMAAKVAYDLMNDPVWLTRGRDRLGNLIHNQAAIRRALVFTQPAFAVTNAVDSVIKGAWSRFTTRSFHTRAISSKAEAMSLLDFGFDPTGQLLHDMPVAGMERIRTAGDRPPKLYWRKDKNGHGRMVPETPGQKAVGDMLRRAQGVSELPAQGAKTAENFMKLRLAQSMYDEVYRMTLKEVGNENLADALSRKFIHDEINRLWPTAGDGPIEQLFNQMSPFISYQAKNHMVYIGEMFGHPQLFNYFNRIGDYLEAENRKQWAEEHPHEKPDDRLMRMIELPWAEGVFVDLGALSDASRGVKPFYDIVEGKATVQSFASQFIRLASASDLNMVYGIFNAIDFGKHMEWVQGRDEDGFPTGTWSQVEVGWEAPWGGEANFFNSFWPVEMAKQAQDTVEAMDGKYGVQALTQLVYKTLFFGGIKQADRGFGLNGYFFALKEVDPEAAKAFLETADGKALQMWWADKTPKTQEFFIPSAVKKMFHPEKDQKAFADWNKSQAWRDRVDKGFEELDTIDKKWNNVIWKMDPSSQEFSDAKKRQQLERWEYFRAHPEMLEFFALTMGPAGWAKFVDEMTLDHLVDSFFNIKEEDFKTYDDFQAAREAYLKANPAVVERLGKSRTLVEQVWQQTEDHWFDILDKVGRVDTALEAARQAGDYELADQLYLIKELQGAELDKEVAVQYWDPTTDFQTLPKGMQGPTQQRAGPFGQKLIPRFRVLPDFSKWQWERADEAGKAKITRDRKYATLMGEVINRAKKSGDFGASFYKQLQANPWLMNQYFAHNPGKREQWAATNEYFNLISKFGILMKQGRFTEGNRYFDNLPNWVKERYYAKHKDRRAKAKQNLEYVNWMSRWVAHYKRKDYEGGAAFFDKMPEWVKSRYYQKHPGGFGRGGGKTSGYAKAMGQWVDLLKSGDKAGAQKFFDSMPKAYRDRYRARHPESAYSKAMGKWVGMLEAGDKEGAKKFFDSLPKALKDRYYSTHPEQKLRDDIKRSGQLAHYFSADDANRAQYLKENPEFAKWLAKQSDSENTRRMLIMAGYRAIPKDEAWMKRAYREKFPEIFSQEAAGERSLKKTYSFLQQHPEYNAPFEKWLAAVWASYAENVKHAGTRPKPVESIHPRQHGMDRRRPHRGKSAAWVRVHSLS